MVLLAAQLRGRSIGLTIPEIMEVTERSRPTVERMLAGLIGMGVVNDAPRLDEDHHRTKRWRLAEHCEDTLRIFMTLEPRERSAVERLLATLEVGPAQRGLAKLLSHQRSLGRNLVTDLGILIERDAHVDRVGPTHAVPEELMDVLEPAIAGSEVVELVYGGAGQRGSRARRVNALGLLVGRFSYFVASEGGAVKSFRLDLIASAERTREMFDASTPWSLKDWARESFGIYHGDDTIDVELLFSPRVAARAERVRFHASQRSERCDGGALRVTLRCCGHRELLHELCHPDWLGEVRIENPPALVKELEEYVEKMLSVYKEC